MGPLATTRLSLLPIHPMYSQRILDGTKLVEFRKRPPAPDIAGVLIYETFPTSAIVGYFEIRACDVASPWAIWGRHRKHGGIDFHDYEAYYKDSAIATAILIGSVQALGSAVRLDEFKPRLPTPQSYVYVNSSAGPRRCFGLG